MPVPSRKGIVVLKMSKEQSLTGNPGAREGMKEFCVQLSLTFIPGETLDNVPYASRLAYEAGRYLGSMDVVLEPPCSLAKFIFNETAAVQGNHHVAVTMGSHIHVACRSVCDRDQEF